MLAHLHVRSTFSLLAGGASPEDLVRRGHALQVSALALTDVNGVYGVVRFLKCCKVEGIHGVVGAEVTVEGAPLVLLARSNDGYSGLCRILTAAHQGDRATPSATMASLAEYGGDLICLTGGAEGLLWRLVASNKGTEAQRWLRQLHRTFRDRVYVELCHLLGNGHGRIVDHLYRLALSVGLPVVATNNVRYAVPDDYRRYDLLTCIRLGLPVGEPHPERPKNAEAYLKSEEALRRLIPYPEAFEHAVQIGQQCQVDLVPEQITPPPTRLPEGMAPRVHLNRLCTDAVLKRYSVERQDQAMAQYSKEFWVITQLGLEEYFLVVREVVEEARRRGIRCAGRGSAANSIVAYLLGITGVDPLAHNLLFERFLHGGRKGTPDIDIDFDSERRDEIITWIEERFGMEQTAMTATVVTYQLRLALRDVAKVLGWPLDTIDKLTPAIPSRRAKEVRTYRTQLVRVLGESPLFELLLSLVEGLDGCPRHMGLHVGGMVLSRRPLHQFSPIQVSANGVKMLQFDKNDVEAMGLVKLDVLGLRMLATLSEAVELVYRHLGEEVALDDLALDDPAVYDLICSNSTVGLFQIESQGQIHLLAVNQPRTFGDLVAEIALFRPGPLQGGMVHPFIRRRKGKERVEYDHPDLEPVLKDTYGIILFQEQVLEVAHRFAGMSLSEADDFRALMSKYRDASEMESMRGRFVEGAMGRGVDKSVANTVFDRLSKFVGYGFCRSHAAAFAKIVYQSAWMKCYYPSAYMAAIMQHRPGMYSLMTLEQEAKRLGLSILLPDINVSGVRYELAALPEGGSGIRKPLISVDGVTDEMAKGIVRERMEGHYRSVEDVYDRLSLPRDVLDNLARSGALDRVADSSRGALWEVGVLRRRVGVAGQPQERTLFDLPSLLPEDMPDLPELTALERLAWDYQTHHAGRAHPLTLVRRSLGEYGILSVADCRKLIPLDDRRSDTVVTIAGNVIMRQRPPTANGVMFVTLEDETGFLQCVLPPPVQERYDELLTSPALVISGVLQAIRHWRGLVAIRIWALREMLGGYAGQPGQSGGRDRLEKGEGEVHKSNIAV